MQHQGWLNVVLIVVIIILLAYHFDLIPSGMLPQALRNEGLLPNSLQYVYDLKPNTIQDINMPRVWIPAADTFVGRVDGVTTNVTSTDLAKIAWSGK